MAPNYDATEIREPCSVNVSEIIKNLECFLDKLLEVPPTEVLTRKPTQKDVEFAELVTNVDEELTKYVKFVESLVALDETFMKSTLLNKKI